MAHLDALSFNDIISQLFYFVERESNQNMTIYRLDSVSSSVSKFYSVCIVYLFVLMFSIWCEGPSWSWTYGSWIYNYLCNQCLSPLMLWVRILLRWGVLDTTLCDKVCQWLAAGQWFSLGTPVSSTNKTDHHDKSEILLKVALTP